MKLLYIIRTVDYNCYTPTFHISEDNGS